MADLRPGRNIAPHPPPPPSPPPKNSLSPPHTPPPKLRTLLCLLWMMSSFCGGILRMIGFLFNFPDSAFPDDLSSPFDFSLGKLKVPLPSPVPDRIGAPMPAVSEWVFPYNRSPAFSCQDRLFSLRFWGQALSFSPGEAVVRGLSLLSIFSTGRFSWRISSPAI